MRITGASPFECPACHGLGYSRSCQAEMQSVWNAELGYYVETMTMYRENVAQVGSGCLQCGGTGQLDAAEGKVYDVD